MILPLTIKVGKGRCLEKAIILHGISQQRRINQSSNWSNKLRLLWTKQRAPGRDLCLRRSACRVLMWDSRTEFKMQVLSPLVFKSWFYWQISCRSLGEATWLHSWFFTAKIVPTSMGGCKKKRHYSCGTLRTVRGQWWGLADVHYCYSLLSCLKQRESRYRQSRVCRHTLVLHVQMRDRD